MEVSARGPQWSEPDAFAIALAGAESRRDRARRAMASVPVVEIPGVAGLPGLRMSSPAGGSGTVALDVPVQAAGFVEALGLRRRSAPGRAVVSFEADTPARIHAASAVRVGRLRLAPSFLFFKRKGLVAGAAGEGRPAFVASPSAARLVADLLGSVVSSDGSVVIPAGPRRLCLLRFADDDALRRLSFEYGGSSMFEHAVSQPLAAPFLMYLPAARRFVFVDAPDDALAPFLEKSGFRRRPDSSWASSSPSAANAFRRFADPAFRSLIEAVYARWPFIDDGFSLDDFDAATGREAAAGGGRGKPPSAETPSGKMSYDPGTSLFYTLDAAAAWGWGFEMLDAIDCAAIAKAGSFPAKATWGTPFLSAVLPCRTEADDEAEIEIIARLVEASVKPPLPVGWRPPDPAPGFAYDEDQVVGVRFAMRGPVISIADDMGIGKSFEAAGLIDAVKAVHPTRSPMVLYVLPASQRDGITKVVAEVPGSPLAVLRLDGCGVDPRPSNVDVVPAAQALARRDGGVVVVVSYETLVREASLLSVTWDLVVFDESHQIKNVDAERTAAVIDPAGDGGIRFLKVVFMSGTQITNTMSDYWPLLRLLLKDAMASRARFKGLFAVRDGALGDEAVKFARIARMARAFDSGIRIRRTKEELGKTPGKLPPTVVEVPVEDPEILALASREVELHDSLEGIADARRQRKVRGEIDAIRKKTARAKIPFVVDALAAVAEREPVVAFTHHVEIAEELGEALIARGFRVAILTGRRTTPAERFRLIEEFQEGLFDFIVATMACAGVGYTMTRSAYCAIVELDWKAHVVAQAPDRLDRRGQLRKVAVLFFVIARSFDSIVARNIVGKTRVADVANGDDVRRLGSAAQAAQAATAAHTGMSELANSACA